MRELNRSIETCLSMGRRIELLLVAGDKVRSKVYLDGKAKLG